MPKTVEIYPFLKALIEQWPVRAKRLGLNNGELAELADISEAQFSQIINFRVANPRMSTIDRVERALKSKEGA